MTLSSRDSSFSTPTKSYNRPRRSSTTTGKSYSKPGLYRTQSLQKALEKLRVIKVRFYRNGDKFHQGIVYAVSSARFRTFDSLLMDLTKKLSDNSGSLPKGVRFVFSSDGKNKITSLDDLQEGASYVCSSFDSYKRVDYGNKVTPEWCTNVRAASSTSMNINIGKNQAYRTFQMNEHEMRSCTSHEQLHRSLSRLSQQGNCTPNHQQRLSQNFDRDIIRPRLVTIIRNGIKPRKSVRVLLNKKTCHSLEQVFNDITQEIKLDSGAVRKVFMLSGKQVLSLQDFFGEDEIFIAYGSHEKTSQDDFIVVPQEVQRIRPYSNTPSSSDKRRVKLQRKYSNSSQTNSRVFTGSNGTPRRNPRPISMPSHSALYKQQLQQNKHNQRMMSSSQSARNSPMTTVNQDVASMVTSRINSLQGDSKWPQAVNAAYDVGEVIGDGTYAEVRKCFDRNNGNKFALKIVDRSKYVGKENLAINEVNLLRSIRHKNIIRLIRDLTTPHDIYMVLEYANGGDLFEVISSAGYLSEIDSSLYLFDIMSALHYLHSQSIVHRDVKPENLLVSTSVSTGKRCLKLADFGMATIINNPLYTVCGTPTYVAPEIIINNGYGIEVDIWAAGIITYIMLCGYPPFRSNNNDQEQLFDEILKNNLDYPTKHWEDVSPSAFQIIHLMLKSQPSERPTARQLLANQWLIQIRHQEREVRKMMASSSKKPQVNSPATFPKKKRVNSRARKLQQNNKTFKDDAKS